MASEKFITLEGSEFKLVKFNAMEQFRLARRLAGLFGAIAKSGGKNITSGAEQAGMFLDRLSEMSDEEADALFLMLFKNTYIKEPKGLGWSPLVNGGQLMYDNLDLAVFAYLGWEVVVLNLQNFTQQISQWLSPKAAPSTPA